MHLPFPRSILCILASLVLAVTLLSSGCDRSASEQQGEVQPPRPRVLPAAYYRDALVAYLVKKNIHPDQVKILREEQWRPYPTLDGTGVAGYTVGNWSIFADERRFYWRVWGWKKDPIQIWVDGTFQVNARGSLTVASWEMSESTNCHGPWRND